MRFLTSSEELHINWNDDGEELRELGLRAWYLLFRVFYLAPESRNPAVPCQHGLSPKR